MLEKTSFDILLVLYPYTGQTLEFQALYTTRAKTSLILALPSAMVTSFEFRADERRPWMYLTPWVHLYNGGNRLYLLISLPEQQDGSIQGQGSKKLMEWV